MLYGFDFDGTLVESFGSTPLPGAREQLDMLPKGANTFIATNQAGPVFRAVLNDRKYPTVEQVVANIRAGLSALEWRPKLLLLCYCSDRSSRPWWQAEAAIATVFDRELATMLSGITCQTYFMGYYRKPRHGMLGQAKQHFGDAAMIYVGDRDEDRKAAAAAKARFVDAAEWRNGAVL